jgi:hypothetical protein
MDGLHLDTHLDLTHNDAPFSDTSHSDHIDDHWDTPHTDVPFSDTFNDAHTDAPFSDTFSDNGFGDEGFGDDGNGGGGGCFTAETLVAMSDGRSRPIAEIAVGDLVLARGEETEALTARRVSRVRQHRVAETLLLRLTGGDALETTRPHRFFVLGRGFVAVGRLRPGDQLVAYPGANPITLEAVETRPGTTQVYSLVVEHDPTYLVGAQGLLVHVIKEDTPGTGRPPGSGRRPRPASRAGAETAMLGQIQGFLQTFGQQMAQQVEARDRAADQRLVQVLSELTRFAAELQNALTGLEGRVARLEGRSGGQGGGGQGGSE